MGEHLVELNKLRAELLHFALLHVVRTVRGRYQQAQDQGGDGCNQPHHQFDHVLRFGILMMRGDADGDARQRPAENEYEYEDGDECGIHGATLSAAGAGSMMSFAPASFSSR